MIRGPSLSEKDRHLCMRDERLWDVYGAILAKTFGHKQVTSEQCRVSRPQFPQSTHGTPQSRTSTISFPELRSP